MHHNGLYICITMWHHNGLFLEEPPHTGFSKKVGILSQLKGGGVDAKSVSLHALTALVL